MKIIFIICFSGVALAITTSLKLLENEPSDYLQLVDFANILSFTYCLKYGLKEGKIGKDTFCKTKQCRDNRYNNLEVIETFNFNDVGDVGAGFYALDNENKRIILAFRGSSSRRDWIANIDAMPRLYEPLINLVQEETKVTCNKCLVHRGFYNFLKNNAIGVIKNVKSLKDKHKHYQLVILGHSLGASFALLSGIEFQLMKLNPLVVTFAGPKIGNKEMMSFVDELFETNETAEKSISEHLIRKGYIRVVHKGDIVPLIPPTSIFRHGGTEYFINKDELPHTPGCLERRGSSKHTWEITPEAYTNPTSIINHSFGKNAHSTYFIKISGCK